MIKASPYDHSPFLPLAIILLNKALLAKPRFGFYLMIFTVRGKDTSEEPQPEVSLPPETRAYLP